MGGSLAPGFGGPALYAGTPWLASSWNIHPVEKVSVTTNTNASSNARLSISGGTSVCILYPEMAGVFRRGVIRPRPLLQSCAPRLTLAGVSTMVAAPLFWPSDHSLSARHAQVYH